MKRLLLTVVVAALALTLVPLAVAGGPGGGGKKRGHKKFNLVGTVVLVTAADATTDPATPESLAIQVKAGSHIKKLKGTEATFVLAAEATYALAADLKVWQLTEDGKAESSLDQLAADDWVKARGTIEVVGGEKVYTITCIKYRDLSPDVEPTPEPSPPPAEI